MRLKHLTLQGYKSFATKTEFLFPTGITAIVGPNGSGKSNIADAIRWVLGEQRMRTLRGRSAADMIFAGGRRRARAGMAEASLTFDNADGWLPIDFSEVTLTRRAYRSGENEYLINGSRVRLRDIAELLAESGLSQRAYTVIGQGLVDAALSLRPQERRTLFEEAAGISVYRARREQAVQRLDETQRNLERVHDIVAEITPRLRRLEREAERVEEHRRVAAHLERLQRTWYGYQWGRGQATLDRTLQKASTLASGLEEQQRESAALRERLAHVRQEEGEVRARLRDWHRESADLHDQANEVQRELAVAEERTRLLRVRREELLAELEPLSNQQEAQAEQVAQIRAQVEQLERIQAERREQAVALEREWAAVKEHAQEPGQQRALLERELRDHRAQVERLNQALAEARAEAARLASDRAVAEERARQLQARHAEVVAELVPLKGQREAQAGRVTEAGAQIEEAERALAGRREQLANLEREWTGSRPQAQEPDDQRARLERELRDHRGQLERLNQALLEARAEAARVAGEQAAMERTHVAWTAYDAGVRALLQADLDGVLGPLASLIRVTPEWERAIEAALGDDLQAVVVERSSLAEEARQILESAGGRLTLLPLDGLRPPPSLPAGARRAADVVSPGGVFAENVRPAIETLLGCVALCADLLEAQALLPHLPPGCRCVTGDGLVLRTDGAISVGSVEKGGVLADEQARKELPARLEEAQRRCEQIEDQQRGEAGRIAALEGGLEDLARQEEAAREEAARFERERLGPARTEVAVAEEALRSQQAALERERPVLERLEAQLDALRRQAGDLEVERAAVVALVQEVQEYQAEAPAGSAFGGRDLSGSPQPARLVEIERRCEQIEDQQRGEAGRIAALEGELEDLARQEEAAREEAARFELEGLGPARTEVAVAEEALRSRQSALEREKALLERLGAQRSARSERVQELEAEHSAGTTRVEELRRQSAQLEAWLEEVGVRIRPAEAQLVRLREEQQALEGQAQRLRDRVRDAEARQGHAELEVARCRDELKLWARRIEEDLGLVELELSDRVTAQTPLPLRPLVSQLPVVENLPEGLEDEVQRLKARVRRMGSINPNAPSEYADAEERHRFLTEQSADLEAAALQLRQVVAELDDLMEVAFREIFDQVAARFSDTFTSLFNGGSARLELTEPDDLMNTGVDIVARPPGKRAQRLALLSGGERALTAVALLFALLDVSPTPFCVLDEVDAMLDEANVERFRAMLEDLAQQTQFVVITHNRVTTEAAHAIYGVSMGADGVSQVVSLELE